MQKCFCVQSPILDGLKDIKIKSLNWFLFAFLIPYSIFMKIVLNCQLTWRPFQMFWLKKKNRQNEKFGNDISRLARAGYSRTWKPIFQRFRNRCFSIQSWEVPVQGVYAPFPFVSSSIIPAFLFHVSSHCDNYREENTVAICCFFFLPYPSTLFSFLCFPSSRFRGKRDGNRAGTVGNFPSHRETLSAHGQTNQSLRKMLVSRTRKCTLGKHFFREDGKCFISNRSFETAILLANGTFSLVIPNSRREVVRTFLRMLRRFFHYTRKNKINKQIHWYNEPRRARSKAVDFAKLSPGTFMWSMKTCLGHIPTKKKTNIKIHYVRHWPFIVFKYHPSQMEYS